MNQDLKHHQDSLGRKYTYMISIVAFLAIGIWMFVSPSKPDHSTYEKGSLYLLKEMWGTPLAIVILSISSLLFVYVLNKILLMKNKTWIKWSNGYYYFDKEQRVSGLHSIYDKNDLVVFNTHKNEVLRFKNYAKSGLESYKRAHVDKQLSCSETYWNAGEKGYVLMHNGRSDWETTSEKRDNDLIVRVKDKHLIFKFEDYYNRKNTQLYKAAFA